jgi:hypothetical protein
MMEKIILLKLNLVKRLILDANEDKHCSRMQEQGTIPASRVQWSNLELSFLVLFIYGSILEKHSLPKGVFITVITK